MGPRIHEIQECIIASIHGRFYNPTEPPTTTPFSRIPHRERERLEIWGDALLREKLVNFLFHNFPRGPGFISTIKAAMLSNLTFTNILLKAHGHTRSQGFPVDKPVADRLETMAACCRSEDEEKFDEWFYDTFVPLINDAESQWDRPHTHEDWHEGPNVDLEDMDLEPIYASTALKDEGIPKKSWVASCIEAATAVESWPESAPLAATSRPRRRDEEHREHALSRPKSRWAEAMEVAGKQTWVEAMISTSKAAEHPENDIPTKENCPPRPEPHRRRAHDIYRAHDVYIPSRQASRSVRASGRPSRFADTSSGTSSAPEPTLPAPSNQASQKKTPLPPAKPPSATRRSEPAVEREPFEPLHDTETAASALVALPPRDSANTDAADDGFWMCEAASSPMKMSPNWSPTKFISPPPSPCTSKRANLRDDASPTPLLCGAETECEPAAFQSPGLVRRRRGDSVSSICSSLMDISVCDSPTKFLCFGQEPALAPTKQGPPDILCSPGPRRGPIGDSGSNSRDAALGTHRDESENVVAQDSTFWPGQMVVFRYKQNQKALHPVVQLY